MVKKLPARQETWVLSLGWEDPLEKVIATHSSILAWRIPWTEEPGGATLHGVAKNWTWLSDQHFHFHWLWPIIWLGSQVLGRYMIWKLMTRKYEKRYETRTLWMGKNMIISVSHMNTQQMLPKQRTIFIIKWKRLPVMWIPVSFFPQPPLSSPNKPMNKVAMVTGIDYAWPQQNRLPLTKVGLATATAEYPICQQQRPTPSEDPLEKGYPLQYSGLENSMDCIVHGVTKSRHNWVTFTFPGVVSELPGGLSTLVHFHHEGGNILFLLE